MSNVVEHSKPLINENIIIDPQNRSLAPAVDGEESECVISTDHDVYSTPSDSEQPVTIKGAIFTMCISIVGAGCLSLSYALRNVGLIMGISLIILGALMSYFTLDLLLISAEYLPQHLKGVKPERNISYLTLAEHSYGMKLSKIVKVIMAFQYFGASVAYMVVFCVTIDLVWSIYFSYSIYIECALIISYCIIFPIALLRDLSSLGFTSLLGFTCSIYLCIVVFIEYFILCSSAQTITSLDINTTCIWKSEFHLTSKEIFPTDVISGFLTAFPLIMFAFIGHPYVLPLYDKLLNPSIGRMRMVFKTALSVINIIYLFVAIFGFLLFLESVCGNLLLNNFKKHIDIIIAALGISLSCILTEPLFIWNFRRIICILCLDREPKDISKVWHIGITFSFLSVNVLLAIFVKSISVVFGFIGSTTCPTLGYLLPAVFFCKMAPNQYKVRKGIAVILAIAVSVISLSSLGYKIYSPGDLDCDNTQTI